MSLRPTIEWDHVTTDEGGGPLTGLAGYRVFFSLSPVFADTLGSFEILVPCRPSLRLTDLPLQLRYQTVYFRVAAFDQSNNQSEFSEVVSALVSGGLVMK